MGVYSREGFLRLGPFRTDKLPHTEAFSLLSVSLSFPSTKAPGPYLHITYATCFVSFFKSCQLRGSHLCPNNNPSGGANGNQRSCCHRRLCEFENEEMTERGDVPKPNAGHVEFNKGGHEP